MTDFRWPRTLLSFCSEIRDHKSLVLRGIGAGWAFWAAYAALKGWVLAHFFQNLAFRMPLVFGHGLTQGLFWWILRLCAWAGSGWFVARVYRAHAATLVIAFAASVFLLKLQVLPWTFHLFVLAIHDTRYGSELIAEWMSVILPPIFVLLGSLPILSPKMFDRFRERAEHIPA